MTDLMADYIKLKQHGMSGEIRAYMVGFGTRCDAHS